MLANKAFHIWANKPKLSIIFWLAVMMGYLAGILAITSIFFADYSYLQGTGAVGERATFHLRVVRLTIITIVLLIFPILLFTSLRRLFYFLLGVTAWALIIYVDDVLVLYTLMERPQSAPLSIVIGIRPFVIIGLLWMCFELNLRLKNGS